jgi:hypothetical protein
MARDHGEANARGQKDEPSMPSFLRSFATFALTALTLATATGGCSAIGKAIDCDQMCEEVKTCDDGDLNVQHCADRCEDKADNNTLRKKLDQCTDCLDNNNYACAEVPDKCPVCQTVTEALL